jgi:hypothetical protein
MAKKKKHPFSVDSFLGTVDGVEVHNSLLNVVLHDNPHLRRTED